MSDHHADAVELANSLPSDPLLPGADAEMARLVADLRQLVADVLRVAPAQIDAGQALSTLGLDSLTAVDLQHRIEADLGVVVHMGDILQGISITQLARQVLAAPAAPASAAPIQTTTEHPLSYGQRALWFLHQLAPESTAYTIASAVRLRGALDVPALRRAFQQLLDRHPALRTTFIAPNGEPVQQIHEHQELYFQIEDARDWSAAFLDSRLVAVADRPFDLAHGPLLRIDLFVRSADEHVLLLTVQHLVADLWSLTLLLHQLTMLYPAEQAGSPTSLAPSGARYTDYVRWQAEMLAGPEGDRLWRYWQRQLAGAQPVLHLPTNYPYPPVQTYRGAAHPFRLDAELTGRLKGLAQAARATVYATLLATFQVLLYHYSGQTDILVGSPTSGRNRAMWVDIVGYFVNPLVLRADLAGNPPFAAFLAQVRQTVLSAFAHQDYPFAALVERLQPVRDPSRSPLVQVAFAIQAAHLLRDEGLSAFALGEADATMRLADLQMESVALEQRVAPFDLMLIMAETAGGLVGSLQYNQDIFNAATIARMAQHWQTLLAGIVAAPQTPIGALPLLTPAEQHQILVAWNETQAGYPDDRCIQDLIQAQVARNPDAVALIYDFRDKQTRRQGDKETTGRTTNDGSAFSLQLTYAALNQRANQLAWHLRARGVGRGARVGICMDRSLELIIGLLGVLKAGGTYVPLDPAWPAERLHWIADSIGVQQLIVTTAQLRTIHELRWRLPQLTDLLCLDVHTPTPPPEPLDPAAVQALWDQVAERAVDRVTAGGFINSYTGQPFSEAEVDAYRDRVVELVRPQLGPQRRVLEIGCGAGLIMFALAPQVGRYLGLDPSALTQARNREYAEAHGHTNITLLTGFAHEIASLEADSYDLIIIASTAQFFPGPLYLRRIVELALTVLAPGGALVLADIMDARQKQAFRASLEAFQHEHRATPNIHTKTQLHAELYIDEALFAEFQADFEQITDVMVLHRADDFANELRYRYDVIIAKAGPNAAPRRAADRVKQQPLWTAWHLRSLPENDPPTIVAPDDIAYVIYTSGSTGVPKGVVVQHRAVLNLIDWVNTTYRVGAADRLLFVTSVCFDLSVYDIFGMLSAGGAIQVAASAELREPERLVQMLYQHQITFWDSAPAMLQQLVPFLPASPSGQLKGRLRLVFLSGDWIPVTLPDRIRTVFQGSQVISLGGATEATVWSNSYLINAVDPHWVSIPYGKPLQNAQYYILDAHYNPCPIGVPGDLYIGGTCLALGYANDPSQTAARFVPNPFAEVSGAGYRVSGVGISDTRYPAPDTRLYKTGDRARYWPDGVMEFLGRRDLQVKVRGFRIELEEIEAVLTQHAAVRTTAVVARRDASGDTRLVAYVVPSETLNDERSTMNGPEWSSSAFSVQRSAFAGELRAFLKEKLPEYMVPSLIILLDALPLTANGKVHHAALPAPDWTHAARATAFAAPGTAVEATLAQLWAEVLRLDEVGIQDNFFELGGHSLLATQLIVRLPGAFGVTLPLRTLFEAPTVAGLAQRIEQAQKVEQAQQRPPLQSVARDGVLPLSFAQQRLWLLHQLAPLSAAYNLPAAIEMRGRLDRRALAASLTQLNARHESLRTLFRSVDGSPVQIITGICEATRSGAKEGSVQAGTLPVIDLSGLLPAVRAAVAQRLTIAEAQRPFDLTRGPLLRTTLLRLDDDEHILLLTMHHIISDGWSIGVLIRDVTALYAAQVAGQMAALPALPVQYADYAVWQQQWPTADILAQQLAYWKARLAGAPALLDLLVQRPRPAQLTIVADQRPFQLSAQLTTALMALSQREESTLFMALLAAFQVLLMRYTGQDDIVVGTPIAGRTHPQIEELIGCFVNTLVLRTDLSGAPTFRALLRRVREITLGAYAHQDLPFERLVEEIQPERNRSLTPLFQVMLVLQNTPVQALDMPGLTCSLLSTDNGAAKVDLIVTLEEAAQGLRGSFQFNVALFDADGIARMIGHFERLLTALSETPDQPVHELPLLTDAEQHQLLVAWDAATAVAQQQPACLHELFEQQVARDPDAVAVAFDGQRMRYGELNARSNQIAHGLRALGVRDNAIVAVLAQPGFWPSAIMLGTLKAGCGCMCLDISLPQAQLKQLLDKLAPACLIVEQASLMEHQALVEQTVRALDCPIVVVDGTPGTREQHGYQTFDLAGLPQTNPHIAVAPDDLACITYSIGLDGALKGVLRSHRTIVDYLQWQSRRFGIDAMQRVAQLDSPALDGTEIFSALCCGATLYVPSFALPCDPFELASWLATERITFLRVAAHVFHRMLRLLDADGDTAQLAGLEQVLLVGEPALTLSSADLARRAGLKLATSYGPAELVAATCHDVTEFEPAGPIMPLGRAIDGRQIMILDQHQQLCPIGVAGTITIRSADATEACYTGDRGYRLPDGTFGFQGRTDRRITLRGITIQLEEIEAVLVQHPSVLECAITLHIFESAGPQLVATIATIDDLHANAFDAFLAEAVASSFSGLPEDDLRAEEFQAFLREKLPAHLVPSGFALVAELPRTLTGVVDWAALPQPVLLHAGGASSYVAPNTPLEQTLATIFEDLLHVEKVGIYDNFFDWGGHSLLANRAINKVREACAVELPLHRFFDTPTIAGLAQIIEQSRASRDDASRRARVSQKVLQLSDDEVRALLAQKRG